MRITILLALALLFCITSASQESSDSRPNILILISDDHSTNDIGIMGNQNVRTPNLDALASGGIRFNNAYVTSPQCSPSRASLVSGRSPHATGTSRLHSTLTIEYDTIVDQLKRTGYYAGAFRKVHLGEKFQSRWNYYGGNKMPFIDFFQKRPKDRPFFLWVGFHDPHRPFQQMKSAAKRDASEIRIPEFLPDSDEVRSDLINYYNAIERMDADAGQLLKLLQTEKLSSNTIIFFIGDNGMPFPGAKGSLYDAGVRVPLIVRWEGKIKHSQINRTVVSLLHLAPTWLELAKATPIPRMEGKSLLPLLTGGTFQESPAFFERNWHDNLDFIRGVRFGKCLLIRNYLPQLPYEPTLDLADSPSWKSILKLHREKKLTSALETRYFRAPRPEIEFYDVEADPFQLNDLAADPARASNIQSLKILLSNWMVTTNDFLPPPIPQDRGPQGESVHP